MSKRIIMPGRRGGGVTPPEGLIKHAQHEVAVRKAFDKQNLEIKKISEAFNTMRLLCICLVQRFADEDLEVPSITLSAKDLNSIDLTKTGINVFNAANTDDVILTITHADSPIKMSVSGEGELEPDHQPLTEAVVEEFPIQCICGDMDTDHIGKIGRCKAKDCVCSEFKENKYTL